LHDGRCSLLLRGEVELREEREEDLDAADRVQRRVNGMSDHGFHILKEKKKLVCEILFALHENLVKHPVGGKAS
jgi:hypothetical protein